MNKVNLVSSTDSYKYSHYLQYPKGTQRIYSYIESRGGQYPFTLFFGLQAYIKEYLMSPITKQDIDEAEELVQKHVPGLPFNRAGWEHILKKHGGYSPVKIRAVKEGSIVPVQNVLLTIENNDEKVPFIVGHLETTLLRGVWYATTVATRSYVIKEIIKKYLDKTSDIKQPMEKLIWSLHDFGMRGVSSRESAGIAGGAHLISFLGTDNSDALDWIDNYYGFGKAGSVAGFSIPASEHSVSTIFGKAHEVDYFKNMIKQFGKPGAIFATVADTYDIYNVCRNVLPQVKEDLIKSGATMVIRPDSGNPVDVVSKVANILAEEFGFTVNSKGYKILKNVRIIQGDGINETTVKDILVALDNDKFSAENIAFGCGGYLLQALNRDTQKFACKVSAAKVNGEWIDVHKDPVTDHGKKSKTGRVTLFKSADGYFTAEKNGKNEALDNVYDNGIFIREQNIDDIRKISNEG